MKDQRTVITSPEAPAQVSKSGLVGKSQEAEFIWLLRGGSGEPCQRACSQVSRRGHGPLSSAGSAEKRVDAKGC